MSSRNDIANIEAQIAGLTAKIAERESNHAAAGPAETFSGKDDGVKRWSGEDFRHTERFVQAHRDQLRALQYDLVCLRMTGGGWLPSDVIAAMQRK